ncbi:MAG: hypothetical protein VB074_05485 [Proteiniphilum sp.]|jgi:hypothetical protein|uniref:hypothetical protein n=1 Tax=Proteiniphilum sp. TaxID=1926877 RepID=UPI002B1FE53F|nr:hypothetical protein [Proteiniphilum sp.]MEA5127616.1 hypothetical protein [Proteiniphilum sp.]
MTLTEKDFYYLDRNKIENLVTLIYDKLSSNKEKIIDHELYSGKLGLVLYYFYYSQIQNKIIDEDIKLLDEILDNISTLNIKAIDDIFLFSHLGLVIQTLLDEDSSKFSQYKSLLLDIDKILFPYMEYWVNNSNFEFFIP